jgi:hypothetical protein
MVAIHAKNASVVTVKRLPSSKEYATAGHN